LHIGLARAPKAADNLQKVVQMLNQRNPDAVVVTGDIGERPSAWEEAREVLKGLKAKVYYIPGNHDVHSDGPAKYRSVFGDDYYKFRVKYVTVYALDSQLLGNWDEFEAHQEPPTAPNIRQDGDKMLDWLAREAKGSDGDDRGQVVIAMQHVPDERDGGFPNDPKPYWIVNGEYKKREEDVLKKLGVHDILAGHWHDGRVFDAGGFRWHIAPATSWSTFGGKLGFAVHTIMPDGRVKTEFVYLD
jgi:3',5'-cyclic AMP phosphodiesterase CpdA